MTRASRIGSKPIAGLSYLLAKGRTVAGSYTESVLRSSGKGQPSSVAVVSSRISPRFDDRSNVRYFLIFPEDPAALCGSDDDRREVVVGQRHIGPLLSSLPFR